MHINTNKGTHQRAVIRYNLGRKNKNNTTGGKNYVKQKETHPKRD